MAVIPQLLPCSYIIPNKTLLQKTIYSLGPFTQLTKFYFICSKIQFPDCIKLSSKYSLYIQSSVKWFMWSSFIFMTLSRVVTT